MDTRLIYAAAFAILFATIMGGSACATVDKDLEAFASNPNTVSTVESLVETAAGLLERAIAHASTGGMKVLATDPNGVVMERDIAAELRAAKDVLDGVTLPSK